MTVLPKIKLRGKTDPRRGNAAVEFAIVGITFFGLLFAQFDFVFPMFVKATLNFAVRQGARFAITGQTLPGENHGGSIKTIVQQNAGGLLNGLRSNIQVRFYDPGTGAENNDNGPGNIVRVSVEGYDVPRVAPISWSPGPVSLNVSAVDRVEPFPGAPPPL